MKTLKQTLSIILSVLMIVSVFSVIPLTAGAATISSIEIYRLFEPAAGNTFDDTAVCKTSGYTIDHISWYDYSNNKWMTWSDRFVEGTVYEVNVNVKAKDGNSFADMSSVTGTINSYNATIGKVTMEDPEQYLNLSYKFTAAKANTVVSSVAVSGVNAPVAGSKLDFSYNDNSSLYTIDAFEWRNPNNDGIYGKSYVAEENTSYQARFYLVPKTGYKFANDISGTINGFDAEVCSISGYKTYERTVVTYNFTTGEIATEPETTDPETTAPDTEPEETTAPIDENSITNIGIVSVVEPEIGEVAKSKAYEYKPANFTINSVSWYNKTDGFLLMIDDDKFVADKTYTARVKVSAKNGYYFNNPTAMINGKTANISAVDGYSKESVLLVTLDFKTPAEKADPEMITDVNITGVVEPKDGKIPSAKATGEENYFIESVSWYNSTDSADIKAPDTFEKGKEYYVNIFLRPCAGYRFNYNPKNTDELNINATVNGISANSFTVSTYSKGEYIHINCGFTATSGETPETTSAVEETTAPATETTAPVEETTAPVQETTAPVEETTAPVDPQHNHNWGEWILVKRATMDEDGMEQRFCLDDHSHVETHAIPRINGVKMDKFKFAYTGKKISPAFTVKDTDGNLLKKDVDYKVTYYNTVNAGVYIADIEYIGNYEGGDSIQYIIAPAKNTVKVSAKNKSVKAKALSKKKQTVKPITVKNAKGSVTYAKVKKGSSAKLYKKVSVNKKGVITVKKGKYKKGTYKLKVSVTAKGNKDYKAKKVTKVLKIKIT